ncbi:hypothetical protein L873DRAFT_1807684 [Choiromyces venosus 120613-1]|uniref:Uncharacterized protein n=1 Tax=Choiromyces venosus 120613-1 TaxID=1336337 RepID=A0A3N4JRA2_9PEZI|nr:hypothetical protein L873DRAFT_1807684 [Choiromyces venosus 120613-1]
MIHIISNPASRIPSLVSYQKTYVQVSSQHFHTCPHFSPHFRTCPEPSTMPDNNPQTSLITTSDPPSSNNLRQLTNKFHLLSISLRNNSRSGKTR